jgi:glycosyltransferase involved in cell wall biosynthesis
MGLMGRQVVGKEFLDAYLAHGTWTDLVAVVQRRESVESLSKLCQQHPSSRTKERRLVAIDERQFHTRFFPQPPAPLLYTPHPPDTRFAWPRQHGGPTAFALCGVTHTLSTAPSISHLCHLVTTPYESYDALICTSLAVLRLVQTVTGTYADYLRERHGGSPGTRLQLAMIPLGVDPPKFRPPTLEERSARRQALGILDDEVVVLFVGRLSHHAKAHPFPLYHGIDRAARRTGRKVHLVMCGWAANAAVQKAFADGARVFAPACVCRSSIISHPSCVMESGTSATCSHRSWTTFRIHSAW